MEIDEQVDHYKTIFEFIKYVDQLAILGLQTEYDHPSIQHAILSFYEVVNLLLYPTYYSLGKSTKHNIPISIC
jgi:hypothetical protein